MNEQQNKIQLEKKKINDKVVDLESRLSYLKEKEKELNIKLQNLENKKMIEILKKNNIDSDQLNRILSRSKDVQSAIHRKEVNLNE